MRRVEEVEWSHAHCEVVKVVRSAVNGGKPQGVGSA